MIEMLNVDCMEYMKGLEDNAFELAIVDPPYGIGESGGDKKRNRHYNSIVVHEKKEWDNAVPDRAYFDELYRVSENQIIWGANYFIDNLSPSMGWIYWDKNIGGDFSDGELAYTSFKRALRAVQISFTTGLKGGHWRIHPTQKPTKLYEWVLKNYAKEGDRILDTHLGSGSSAIAAHYGGFDFVGCELDTDYYNAAKARFDSETAQVALF